VTVPPAGAGTVRGEVVREWIAADPDSTSRAELEALLAAGDDDALASRFAGRLTFGTAGLRGALGAGPNRMNVAVVRAASAGLAHWIRAAGLEARGVVVGFDHRHLSDVFARDTAGVLAAAGIPVRLASRPWPTPVTAYAVRDLGAAAGVMVTASHNPAADNGYKVYDGTGSQIVPPVDAEISAAIAAAGPANAIAYAPDSDRIEPLGDEALDAYLDTAAAVVTAGGPRDLRVVYTPVHGVGLDVFRALWERASFPPPIVVEAQAKPDPDFPTAPFPNPEEPGVLDLALDLARRHRADLVLANDPDADRLAVAVPTAAGWRVLTGDEIGALLGSHMLATTSGDDRVVARSVVSSRLLDRIATAAGVPARATLTGFKWISRAGDTDGRRLVFGYEEALGYAVTPRVRDKDGLTAALAIADLAARGSLADALDALADAHGLYATSQWSMRFADAAGAAAFTARLRATMPAKLGGINVDRAIDYAAGVEGLPPADLLGFELTDGSRVLVRPSGTEPKAKCYFEVVVARTEPRRARDRLATLRTALQQVAGTMPR
jgi:phosphomannomutase